MCGIAGFVGPWNELLLQKMLDAQNHRGPDGSAVWRDKEASVALGHLRLSIIDLNKRSSQPMVSHDNRYVISFNGEIYNFLPLRRELEERGVRFKTQSDTEVLLELLARIGTDCLNRLEGIFAFALWDRRERELLLVRDQLGIKPLYYAKLGKNILFASELKALVACPDLPLTIEPDAVLNHLSFVWSSSEVTMLKSVNKLRPGHFARVRGGNLEVTRYYTIPVPEPRLSPIEPNSLLELFDRVVADQLIADVPVGALLSGGVDSSAIVASMCRATHPTRIVTFCARVNKAVGKADNFGDDVIFAREIASLLGVELIEVPTDAELIDELPDMLWDLDEPTADFAALQTRKIAAVARHHGFKVLLSGTGGDDLYTGYGRHRAAHIWTLLNRIPAGRQLAAAAVRRLPSNSLMGRRLSRLGQLLALPEESMLLESMSFATLTHASRSALLSEEARQGLSIGAGWGGMQAVLARTSGLNPVERMLQLDLDGFLPDLNLNYGDKMAMKEGIELRVPFLDKRLVKQAMCIPTSQKIGLNGTKKVLKAALKDRLPQSILNRPKQGFGAPVRAWLSGPAREMMEELTSRRTIEERGLFDRTQVEKLRRAFETQQGDVAFTLFSIIAVELWCRSLDRCAHRPRAATASMI